MSEAELIKRARRGERAAFDLLVRPHLPILEAVVRRMIGHPEDSADLVQDTLLRAFQGLGRQYRDQGRFRSWLLTIATRRCLDHLRSRPRWRWDAQEHVRIHMHEHHEAELEAVFSSPDYAFDAREHIAFCFTCVARSLEAIPNAAIVLVDALDLSNLEAARALGLSEPVLRHRLTEARKSMSKRFAGLCALVNKEGVCYQCQGLRRVAKVGRRGARLPNFAERGARAAGKLRARVQFAREANLNTGVMQRLHDNVWRAIEEIEGHQRAL